MPVQARMSLGCGVYMLHLFSKYSMSGENAQNFEEPACTFDNVPFGIHGRRHIMNSLENWL